MHNELESLDLQIDGLKHALGRGEYNPATTKVLSLRDNPADIDYAIRTETLDRLKEENKVLLEKLQEAEKSAQHGTASTALAASVQSASVDVDTVPKQTYINLQAENEELQAKIEQGEKARMRLREIFQKTARELREACKSLLGYAVEPVENGRMKLTTVFGGNDYQLVFGPGQSNTKGTAGKLQLVGGNEAFITSPRVQQGLHFWVAERGCLPGFLASMTLELFEESTRGRTVGYTEG
jgi:mitotic spindle assembly checkpoint protein MAD1